MRFRCWVRGDDNVWHDEGRWTASDYLDCFNKILTTRAEREGQPVWQNAEFPIQVQEDALMEIDDWSPIRAPGQALSNFNAAFIIAYEETPYVRWIHTELSLLRDKDVGSTFRAYIRGESGRWIDGGFLYTSDPREAVKLVLSGAPEQYAEAGRKYYKWDNAWFELGEESSINVSWETISSPIDIRSTPVYFSGDNHVIVLYDGLRYMRWLLQELTARLACCS